MEGALHYQKCLIGFPGLFVAKISARSMWRSSKAAIWNLTPAALRARQLQNVARRLESLGASKSEVK
jgi:hypothetical protein